MHYELPHTFEQEHISVRNFWDNKKVNQNLFIELPVHLRLILEYLGRVDFHIFIMYLLDANAIKERKW